VTAGVRLHLEPVTLLGRTVRLEALGARRVVFTTELLNTKSRAALTRIGAIGRECLRVEPTARRGMPR
jgi:RimJ/RimL family protein N-acetyltransferase